MEIVLILNESMVARERSEGSRTGTTELRKAFGKTGTFCHERGGGKGSTAFEQASGGVKKARLGKGNSWSQSHTCKGGSSIQEKVDSLPPIGGKGEWG